MAAAVFAWPALIAGSSAAVTFGAIGTGFSASTLSGAAAMNVGIIAVTVGALSTMLGQSVNYIKHKFNKPTYHTKVETPDDKVTKQGRVYIPTRNNPSIRFPSQSIAETPAVESKEIKINPPPEPLKREQNDESNPTNPPKPKTQL